MTCVWFQSFFKEIKDASEFRFSSVSSDVHVGFAQVHVLQEQLSVEANSRNDAQVRVQRLLQQNTDLLQHISMLVKQIQELETKANGRFTSSEFLHLPARLRIIHAAAGSSFLYLMATTAEASAALSPALAAGCLLPPTTDQIPSAESPPRRLISSAPLESLLAFPPPACM